MRGPSDAFYPRVRFFQPQEGFWDRIQRADGSSPAARERIRIGQIGLREEFSAGDCDRPRGTPGYWFLARFHGPIRLWSEGTWLEAAPGTTVLWAPGQRQRYGVVSGRAIDHDYVFVSGGRATSLVGALRVRCQHPLPGIASEPFSAHLHALVQESFRALPDEHILENIWSNLLMTVARSAGGEERADERLVQVRRLLEADFAREHSLASLAASVHLSPSHLSATFSKLTGRSPIAFLIDLRLRQARELLRSTDLPIKTVASQVGYDDPYFFSRLFRRRVGASPRDYRRKAAARLPG